MLEMCLETSSSPIHPKDGKMVDTETVCELSPSTIIHDMTLTSGPIESSTIGGNKTISLIGGVALLLNNVTGGGLVLFPQLYQQGGWFLCTFVLLLLMILSALCALMLMECMAMMPGNGSFRKRAEYTTIAAHYCSPKLYKTIQLFYQLSLTASNITMIIQSIQIMDFTIAAIFGSTCALPQIYPSFSFSCLTANITNISPFPSSWVLLSAGFYVTALVTVPFALLNLDNNMYIQLGSFFAIVVIVIAWMALFIWNGLSASYVPAIGSNLSNVVGVSIFNFGFITSIPSWMNEKKESTSPKWTLGISLPLSISIFILVGWMGGSAYVPWNDDETILNKLLNMSNVLATITYYVFPVVVNLTSISVFSIFQRYNLLEQKICSPLVANLYAICLPWLLAALLEPGTGFSNLVNWAGIILSSTVNFIIPPLLYMWAVQQQLSDQNRTETLAPVETPDASEIMSPVSNRSFQKNKHTSSLSSIAVNIPGNHTDTTHWTWLPSNMQKYRIHLSVVTLIIMTSLVLFAIIMKGVDS